MSRRIGRPRRGEGITDEAVLDALLAGGRTRQDVARALDCSEQTAWRRLARLAARGTVKVTVGKRGQHQVYEAVNIEPRTGEF